MNTQGKRPDHSEITTIDSAQIEAGWRAAHGLECCPACRYSLVGLPTSYRCPECNFLFNDDTYVWRPKSFLGWAWPLLVFMIPLWPLSVIAATHHSLRSAPFIASVILLALHSFAILAVYNWYCDGPFIAINPEGVFYRANGPSVVHVDWNSFAGASPMPFEYKWYQPIPHSLPSKVRLALATITLRRKDVEEFQAAVITGLQRYGVDE